MVKILLSGCSGKMGNVIQNVISEFPSLKIVAGIDKFPKESEFKIFKNTEDVNIHYDVLLDFSRADALKDLLALTASTKKPLVLCSTGYTDEDLKLIEDSSKTLPIFKSANMSLGINLINSLIKKISPLLYQNYDIEIIIRDAREVTRFVSGLSEVEGILFYGWSEGVRVCTTLVSDFPNVQALILQSGIAEGWSSYFSYILRELTVEKLKELDNNSDSILEISDFLNCIPDSTSISFSLYLLILGTDKEGNMKFNEELDPEGKGRFSIIDNWIPLADEIVADPTTLIRFAENAPGETWAGILDDIKKIQLPILVLHGLNDGWISPVEAVQIAKAARNNADIILFKGLGHSLSKVSSPLKDEGGTIEDEVIVRVVKWLKKNVE